MLESLETRRLLTAQISGGTLFVSGTMLGDNIDLKIIDNQLVVLIDTQNFRQGFLMAAFKRVSIECDAGDDRVTNEFEFTKPMTISGGAGNDRLTGGGGRDSIDGGDGNDVVNGGDLDVLPVADTLIGGAGTDIVDYTNRGRALKIDLDGNTDDGTVGEHDLVDPTIEAVAGGGGADVIVSNLATGVTLYGNGGNDTLSSGAGNDRLSGGPGQDLIRPHDGDDTMLGGRQRDNMFGGAGNDTVDYSYEDRALVIAPDSQADNGYTGEFDIIGTDVENLVGGKRADSITGGVGPNSLVGNAGNDTIVGLSGDDTIRGGSGNDMMDGGDDADILDGGLGDDDFVGGTGLDTADYSNRSQNLTIDVNDAADDGAVGELDNVHTDMEIVESGSGRDSLLAASSGTQLEGGLNDDTLVGGAGSDTLIGGPDSITGGESDNDLMDGGSGADMMFGGAGTDFIDYSARTADVVVAIDGAASSGEAGEGDTIGKANPDDPNMRLDVEVIRGGGGNDILTAADGVNCTLTGNGGNDTLNGGSGNDNLNGGAGDDVLKGNAGADVLIGGAGTDTADYSDRTAAIMITINGTADDGATSEMDNVGTDLEIILGGGGADMITGYSLLGADHNETLMGGAGADTISGLGGNDLINGDDGDDSLTGGAGADTINGGNGDDKINSTIPTDPNEADTVDGGAGTDTATRDLVDVLTNVEIEM